MLFKENPVKIIARALIYVVTGERSMPQLQAFFDQLTDEYAREKWLDAHTIHISEWNSYCLAACIGTYLNERFLENTFSPTQEKTFLYLFNNAFNTNFNEQKRDEPHSFLASCSFSYVQQMMAIMIIKTYKEDKKLPQSVFNNINNKAGEGLIKFFFQNYFPDIGMVKVDELNPDWENLIKYKDEKDICVIIDKKKPYQFNVDIMPLKMANKTGILEKFKNHNNDCRPTIIIDTEKGTAQRWVNHHGKWLSKTYKNLPKNFISAWKQANTSDKEKIVDFCVYADDDIDFMLSDKGHTLEKQRAAHFELFTNSHKRAKLYNALALLREHPIGNILPHPLRYSQHPIQAKDSAHLSLLVNMQRHEQATFYIPDRIIEDTKKSRVYTIPVYHYKTLPGHEWLETNLKDKPALLIVEDQKNDLFWGKKSDIFSAQPLELSEYDQRCFNRWTQLFKHIFIPGDNNTILRSLSKVHDFDKSKLSTSEHFVVRPRKTEKEYFQDVTEMVSNQINLYIKTEYSRFRKRRERVNAQIKHYPNIKKKKEQDYNYTHKSKQYHQYKSVKKKNRKRELKKAKADNPSDNGNVGTYIIVTIAIIITGIIPGLLVLAGYGIYKAVTKDKKKPPDGNSSNNKTITQNGSTGKIIDKTVDDPKANSLLAAAPNISDKIDDVTIKLPQPKTTIKDSPILFSGHELTKDNASTMIPPASILNDQNSTMIIT
ncbi:MAG: hypothetical protein GY782_00340 [Gammaproteobacteria bacterium]|nr:hypothetical protein [Gammaproteobacteria bacterium]